MSATAPTSENSPSPQEPRGIYGFVLFVFFNLCILFYFLWIIIPKSWTESWPDEPPQKYWAAAIPILFCTTLFMFAFFIYPAMHSMHDCDLDSLSAITDNYYATSKKKSELANRNKSSSSSSHKRSSNLEDAQYKPIPAASDMDLAEVCQLLYNSNK